MKAYMRFRSLDLSAYFRILTKMISIITPHAPCIIGLPVDTFGNMRLVQMSLVTIYCSILLYIHCTYFVMKSSSLHTWLYLRFPHILLPNVFFSNTSYALFICCSALLWIIIWTKLYSSLLYSQLLLFCSISQSAFYVNLYRAVIGPSG